MGAEAVGRLPIAAAGALPALPIPAIVAGRGGGVGSSSRLTMVKCLGRTARVLRPRSIAGLGFAGVAGWGFGGLEIRRLGLRVGGLRCCGSGREGDGVALGAGVVAAWDAGCSGVKGLEFSRAWAWGIKAERSLRSSLPARQAKYAAPQMARRKRAARMGTRRDRRSAESMGRGARETGTGSGCRTGGVIWRASCCSWD